MSKIPPHRSQDPSRPNQKSDENTMTTCHNWSAESDNRHSYPIIPSVTTVAQNQPVTNRPSGISFTSDLQDFFPDTVCIFSPEPHLVWDMWQHIRHQNRHGIPCLSLHFPIPSFIWCTCPMCLSLLNTMTSLPIMQCLSLEGVLSCFSSTKPFSETLLVETDHELETHR